jgi:hypothetical protein
MRHDPAWTRRTPEQGQQGDDAAFATIVGPQDEDAVLDRDDDDQRPQDEGQDPKHHLRRQATMAGSMGGFLQGVEWAGADVAEDHTQG